MIHMYSDHSNVVSHVNYQTALRNWRVLDGTHPAMAIFGMQQHGFPSYMYLYGDRQKCAEYIVQRPGKKHFYEVRFTNVPLHAFPVKCNIPYLINYI